MTEISSKNLIVVRKGIEKIEKMSKGGMEEYEEEK